MGIEILSIVVVAAILGTLGWVMQRRKRTTNLAATQSGGAATPGTGAGEDKTAPASAAEAAERESAALEQSKLVVHALLRSLSESVASLDVDSAKYTGSLDRHRVGIQKAMTLAGIQEIERMLLVELEDMQGANNRYREQLDQANSKLKQQQVELDRLHADSDTDFLTRVANRRTFDARFKEEFSRAKRYNKSFSLMLIDVDNFKQINDTYGHLAGDRVLRALAKILDEMRRESDLLARYGGEEFVFLLPETSAQNAHVAAEAVRSKVERSVFRCDSHALRITISLGVGEVYPKTDTGQSLFARVDAALYRAKGNGRNRVEMATAAS